MNHIVLFVPGIDFESFQKGGEEKILLNHKLDTKNCIIMIIFLLLHIQAELYEPVYLF